MLVVLVAEVKMITLNQQGCIMTPFPSTTVLESMFTYLLSF